MRILFLLFFSIEIFTCPAQVIFMKQGKSNSSSEPKNENKLHVTYMGQPLSNDNTTISVKSDTIQSLAIPDTVVNHQLLIHFKNDSISRLSDSLFLLIREDSLKLLNTRISGLQDRAIVEIRSLYRDIPSILPIRIRSWSEYRISSGFGLRWHPIKEKLSNHSGIDFPLPKYTAVYATADGVVNKILWQPVGLGLAIYIKHRYGYSTVYGHLENHHVFLGQEINRGDEIGMSGNSGLSTAPHLHYSVLDKGVPVNPADFCFLLMKALESGQKLRSR